MRDLTIDVCTAAFWDSKAAPLFCSLPPHQAGDHAAHRSHDTSDVPPIFTWPHSRDDLATWQANEQRLNELAARSDKELRALRAGVVHNRIKAGYLQGGADPSRLAALAQVQADIVEAQGRKFLAGT